VYSWVGKICLPVTRLMEGGGRRQLTVRLGRGRAAGEALQADSGSSSRVSPPSSEGCRNIAEFVAAREGSS
jgi:hypothetical protein